MARGIRLYALLLAFMLSDGIASAQVETNTSTASPKVDGANQLPHFFHLEFVVKDLEEGRALNTRSYSTMIEAGGKDIVNSIRTGSRVVVPAAGAKVPATIESVEVGVNIDCRSARELETQLALEVIADVSNLVPRTGVGTNVPPMIRHIRWNSMVLVPFGTPTIIFSADDVATKRKIQLEVTARPIK